MSIHDLNQKIKSLLSTDDFKDIVILLTIVIVGVGSFFLGRLSIIKHSNETVNSTTNHEDKISLGTTIKALPESIVPNHAFVASRNGTKYYPKGCSGINRIKEENRIYFETEEEAQGAGRTRTTTCQ